MSGNSNNSGKMTGSDAARNQSSNAKSGNDAGFASRAQSAAANNANQGYAPATGSASGPKSSRNNDGGQEK